MLQKARFTSHTLSFKPPCYLDIKDLSINATCASNHRCRPPGQTGDKYRVMHCALYTSKLGGGYIEIVDINLLFEDMFFPTRLLFLSVLLINVVAFEIYYNVPFMPLIIDPPTSLCS